MINLKNRRYLIIKIRKTLLERLKVIRDQEITIKLLDMKNKLLEEFFCKLHLRINNTFENLDSQDKILAKFENFNTKFAHNNSQARKEGMDVIEARA